MSCSRCVGREQAGLERLVERRALGREELEAVVVGREREGDRAELGDAVGEERGEPLVDQPALDRIEEEVVPLAGLHPLDQQLVGGGNAGPRGLELQDPAHRRHLRRRRSSPCRASSSLVRIQAGELR